MMIYYYTDEKKWIEEVSKVVYDKTRNYCFALYEHPQLTTKPIWRTTNQNKTAKRWKHKMVMYYDINSKSKYNIGLVVYSRKNPEVYIFSSDDISQRKVCELFDTLENSYNAAVNDNEKELQQYLLPDKRSI